MFEKCGRTTTDDDGRRRTTDHGYTISSPCEPEGSGELMIDEIMFDHYFYLDEMKPQQNKCDHNAFKICD